MLDVLGDAAAQLGALDGRFLFAALLLQLATLGFRALAWRSVLAAAYPDRRIPVGAVAGAYAAGVALNAFTPARGGEVAKVVLIRARIPGSTLTTVAASLSVILTLDAVLGASLIVGLWAAGLLPATPPSVGVLPVGVAAGVVVVAILALRLRWRLARTLLVRVTQGVRVLRTPGRYLRTVLPFQLAAWACRVGVAFLVLSAFRIEAGLTTAALVVVLNGLSTAVPVPGGIGTQQVLAAYALRGVAPLAGAVSFSLTMQVGVTVVNTLIGMIAMMLMLRTYRPVAALRSSLALVRSQRAG